MPLPAFVLRSYGGGAVVAQLVQEIGPSDTSFTITPTTGWTEADGNPLGTVGPFTVVIDRFTTSVEKILCTSINLVTGVVQVETSGGSGRGYDGTAPQAHVPGGSTSGVQTCWSSIEAAEANKLVFEVIGQLSATGDMLIASAPSVLAALPIGTTGQALQVVGGLPTWANVPGITGTFHAGHLSSNYTLTTSLATFLTTASLGIGTWLVSFGSLVLPGTGGAVVEIEAVAGTATATFEGQTSNSSIGSIGESAPLSFIATVTVAGTLTFQAIATTVTGTPTIYATSFTNSYARATGYTALQIA
jgi:hypothetical protein